MRLASEALPLFTDRGLYTRATCWVESRRTLVDGTIEITSDFLNGLLRRGLPVNFMLFPNYERLRVGEAVLTMPFSVTFEFVNGYFAQAGFDATARRATSEDTATVGSRIGDPAYAPPIARLPAPLGLRLHLAIGEARAGAAVPWRHQGASR